MKINLVLFMLGLILSIFTEVIPEADYQAIAQNISDSCQGNIDLNVVLCFKMPPRDAPGQRKEAAGRSNTCPNPSKYLTALVPETNIGLTVSKRPTFWFYNPFPPTSSSSFVFELLDRNKISVYKSTFDIPKQPGIINVKIPEKVELKTGNQYSWILSYKCNPKDFSKDRVVYGRIEIAEITPEQKIELESVTTLPEKLAIYAEKGWWYDTLTSLIDLKEKDPKNKNLIKAWENLLTMPKVSLDELISEPIISNNQKHISDF